jgi:D-alanyl-lipoteichoic acid biosynthesis protein DltD
MKKILAFVILVPVCFGALFLSQFIFMHAFETDYKDTYARDLTLNKFKSIAAQEAAIKQKDNLFIFGSSELEVGLNSPWDPFYFFSHYKGMQVNLMGQAGFQSLVHAVNFGAMADQLKGQKVVILLSPSWFVPGGIKPETIEYSSSPVQMYAFFFNPNISDESKTAFANRFLAITSERTDESYDFVRNFCMLYVKSGTLANLQRSISMPFYWFQYQVMLLKDNMKTYQYFHGIRMTADMAQKLPLSELKNIDWGMELKNATADAQKRSHNPYGMVDDAYNSYIVKFHTHESYIQSLQFDPQASGEFDDLQILLQVLKESGVKPMLIDMPVCGKWYDDYGVDKDTRQAVYSRIASLVRSYGFEFTDLTSHEYDNYFLEDPYHLGWTGWVYVDQAIVNYYNEN